MGHYLDKLSHLRSDCLEGTVERRGRTSGRRRRILIGSPVRAPPLPGTGRRTETAGFRLLPPEEEGHAGTEGGTEGESRHELRVAAPAHELPPLWSFLDTGARVDQARGRVFFVRVRVDTQIS